MFRSILPRKKPRHSIPAITTGAMAPLYLRTVKRACFPSGIACNALILKEFSDKLLDSFYN